MEIIPYWLYITIILNSRVVKRKKNIKIMEEEEKKNRARKQPNTDKASAAHCHSVRQSRRKIPRVTS